MPQGISDALGLSSYTGGQVNQSGISGGGLDLDSVYPIVDSDNWFKSLPYGFAFYDRSANPASVTGKHTIWLPIKPSNIQVTTHFATNVIPTLYGIVEEHSEVRFYDIVISGTTGYAPRFVSPISAEDNSNSGSMSQGRSAFEGNSNLSLGGFAQQTVGIINQVLNKVNDTVGDVTGKTSNPAGVNARSSGYVAFHNLYRFFLRYKKDTAGTSKLKQKSRSVHPLQFLNYKDGIKYDCVPLDFQLTRSAESPMLYNYTIKLRAFNLRGVAQADKVADIDRLNTLGLVKGDQPINAPSTFAKLSGAVGGAMAAAGGIASGISGFGL